MKLLWRRTVAFVAATLLTSVLASIFSTQFVIAGLQSIGVDIPFATRISMTVGDLAMLRILLITVAACFLIGFPVAGFCVSKLPGSRTAWFALGGGVALIAALLLLSAAAGGMPVAGARTTAGLLFQGAAGAAGGWCFAWISSLKSPGAQ